MLSSSPTALFSTCLVDQIMPEIGVATVKVLRRAGCKVDFPAAQSCCGQPFYNSGFRKQATTLAKQTIEVLEPYDQVVLPSGSCTTMIRKEYPHLFEKSPDWLKRAEAVGAKTFELSEFLVTRLGWQVDKEKDQTLGELHGEPDTVSSTTISPSKVSVTYHDSCHMKRMLGICEQPRQLLKESGYSLYEMEESDRCCGFGGVFSLRMPDVSTAMTAEKLHLAKKSGAEIVVTADPGCLMQMRQLAVENSRSFRHLAEVLEEVTR